MDWHKKVNPVSRLANLWPAVVPEHAAKMLAAGTRRARPTKSMSGTARAGCIPALAVAQLRRLRRCC